MGLLSKFKGCDHTYAILGVQTKNMRKGTMVLQLVCTKCGEKIETFHDLTETEKPEFRQPVIEELLEKNGFIWKDKKTNETKTKLKW
jgi:hypothetical protein